MNRKVSVIVPCYKQGEFLAETLESVQSQTYPNWECIIVNDGSPDNTADIADYYCKKDSRFKYLYQDNAGVSAARNAGIANTDGYYILPLDADDLIAKDYLKLAIEYFEANPLCKVVYCQAKYFGAINYEWNLCEYNYDTLLWRNCIFCSAVYKRQDYLLTPGYNTNMIHGWEDWDFWLYLLKKNDIVHRINSTLFFYRIKAHSRNIEAKINSEELYKQIFNNHKNLYCELENREFEYYAKSKYLEQDINEILQSKTYKFGSLLIFPLRKIKQFFKRL